MTGLLIRGSASHEGLYFGAWSAAARPVVGWVVSMVVLGPVGGPGDLAGAGVRG